MMLLREGDCTVAAHMDTLSSTKEARIYNGLKTISLTSGFLILRKRAWLWGMEGQEFSRVHSHKEAQRRRRTGGAGLGGGGTGSQ